MRGKERSDSRVALGGGEGKGRETLGVEERRVSPVIEKETDSFKMAIVSSAHERRIKVLALVINLRALLQKSLAHSHMVVGRSQFEGCVSVVIFQVHIGLMLEEKLDEIQETIARSDHQSR